MRKLQSPGLAGLEVVLIIVLVVILSLTGYYVRHRNHHSVSVATPKPINTPAAMDCSQSTKAIQVDASITAEAKAAFLAKGFTASWFDQHLQLGTVAKQTNVLTGPSTGGKPQHQVDTVLTYQMCVGDYKLQIGYNHSDDGNSRSFVEIFTPTHDINQVISLKEAQNNLMKCGGTFSKALLNDLTFRDIEDSDALFPNQTRLDLRGSILTSSNNAAGVSSTSAVKGGQGGIVRDPQANIDLETDKCFITTTAVGI